jgi:nucleotide-binding universal stress UspA family protein
MNIGTILVHLDHTERCAARVELAARLGRAHGSHLVGLVPTGLLDGTAPMDADPMRSTEFIAAAADGLRLRAEATAHVFRDLVRGPGSLSYDVRLVDGEPVNAIVHHGHASDLLIVGQVDHAKVDHDKTADMVARDLPEQVVLHSGRPVLIVPCAGHFQEVGKKVLVAWDGTREAAMALRDALPLFSESAQVTLVSLRKEGDAEAAAKLCIPETIAWLWRHGVEAKAEQYMTTIGFADTLLSCASSMNIDLMVMGAYGHTRLRELVLGGVTREILARMNMPVLMAH